MKLLFENWRQYLKEENKTYQIYCDMDGKYKDKDLNTIESFFSPLENFNDVKWL